jgi:hypothetical protein
MSKDMLGLIQYSASSPLRAIALAMFEFVSDGFVSSKSALTAHIKKAPINGALFICGGEGGIDSDASHLHPFGAPTLSFGVPIGYCQSVDHFDWIKMGRTLVRP